jgi:seryl-tRNA synthetase
MLNTNLPKTCPDAVIVQSQQASLPDTEIVDQIRQLDSQWRKLRTKLGKLNRSVNFASNEIGERIRIGFTFQNSSDSVELPSKLIENPESITKAVVTILTIDQLKKLSRHVGTIVKQTKIELRNLRNQMVKHIEKNPNIVIDSVKVSKFFRKIK